MKGVNKALGKKLGSGNVSLTKYSKNRLEHRWTAACSKWTMATGKEISPKEKLGSGHGSLTKYCKNQLEHRWTPARDK